MEVNILEHINEDGTFKESLYENIPSICGEEFKNNEMFKRAGNLSTLFKNAANTKKAFDTKMEGVIKKPDDNATDEEKSRFTKSLAKMLGAPEKPDEYEFEKPEDLAKLLPYDKEAETTFREIFFKHGATKEMVKEIINSFNNLTRRRIEARNKTIQEKFDKDCDGLKQDWKGDSLIENARTAYNALNEFGDDELKKLLKEADLYNNASDLNRWRDCGIDIQNLRILANIGKKMKSPNVSDEGGRKKAGTDAYSKIYTHETSKELMGT